MKNLLATLQEEHRILKKVMLEVATAEPTSTQGRALLQEIENLLILHLQKEESILYPLLQELAVTHPPVQAAIQSLTFHSHSLAMDFILFFQHMENGPGNDILQKSFAYLLDRLLVRLEQEESQLFEILRQYYPQQEHA